MKKIVIFVMLFMCLINPLVLANDVEISTVTKEIDLIGGDSVKVNLSINATNNYITNCKLSTYIEPDGEGINVSYSKNNFSMNSNSRHIIIMYINTSILLVPRTYVITTNIMTEREEQSQSNNNGGNDPHITLGNFIQPDEPDVSNELDEPDNPDDKENNDDTSKYTKKPDTAIFPYWIICIIALVIIVLYLLIRKGTKANKPGETKK